MARARCPVDWSRFAFPRADLQADAWRFAAELEREYDARVRLDDWGSHLELSLLIVPEGRREEGVGSRIMQRIVQYADERGLMLALTPSDHYGGVVTRLRKFYRRFGFVPNRGRVKDFSTREAFIRPARK